MCRLCALCAITLAPGLWGAGITVRFDPASPEVGPFPGNAVTVPDGEQKTSLRINLPLPDCRTFASACGEITALNEFDGFSVDPRIRVRFSGPVNVDTLREGIFFVALDNLTNEEFGLGSPGHLVPINQVMYDPESNSVLAKPDEFLDQHRRYALIVTSAVRDRAGDAVQPDPEFLRCLGQAPTPYCGELAYMIQPLVSLGERLAGARRVVAASVFTTMSATTWLEKARDLLPNFTPGFRSAGPKSVFIVSDIAVITHRQHTRTNPVAFQDVPVNTARLTDVSRIVFGSYRSPAFLNARQVIPAAPTAARLALPGSTNEIFFDVFLPASAKPAAGYPVVIAGYGYTGTPFEAGLPLFVGNTMAGAGYATVSITIVGHGFGPESKLIVTGKNGTTTELAARGRSVDLNEDGVIGPGEGCVAAVVGQRDCIRQTALDLMQLVRAIRTGMDLDGDGPLDLDPERIYYIGQSFGSIYGAAFMATEPNVTTAVLSVGYSPSVDLSRYSIGSRPGFVQTLAARVPPALNRGQDFDDNEVLRYQPVKVNDVPGAIEIQDILETMEWIRIPQEPIAYAPHFRSSTLPGVPLKRVLFQNARGDLFVPSKTASAVVRAANMRTWSVLYRHDIARAVVPQLPENPHSFLWNFSSPASTAIALAAQQQAAHFFASAERCAPDDPCILDVNDLVRPIFGRNLFEVPDVLPEDLGFAQP